MTEATARLDKSGRTIQDMFAGVAPRYDLLNHLLSANLDVVWRRRAAQVLDLPPGAPAVDVCCGTGDLAIAAEEAGAVVTGLDFSGEML
ncbi:MAG TPA: dimethylmenaquinone methyltransferase, partial [Acidobacteria bacterium]|nr:dimethylmenaquinone methyltransferase [Acidobacteriota bacterium]